MERDPAAGGVAQVVPSDGNLGASLAKLHDSARVTSRGIWSQKLLTIISANSIILILDEILGLIEFSSIILLGNYTT